MPGHLRRPRAQRPTLRPWEGLSGATVWKTSLHGPETDLSRLLPRPPHTSGGHFRSHSKTPG
eukprot:7798796-Pyramimonas_sp.AAC.1